MKIILGPPGTGKTTTLLNIMERELESGTLPENICFISFTRRAIKEARDRVKKRFNLTNDKVQNFRTLHSFVFRYLGLSGKQLMKKSNYAELADILSIDITGVAVIDSQEEVFVPLTKEGDRILFLDGVSRSTRKTLRETWEGYALDDTDFQEVDRVCKGLKLYKQQEAIMDYTDILEKFIEEDYLLPFDVFLVDEAQDLSKLQWEVVMKIAKLAKKVYVAGDDDQAIFRWAGADVEYFIALEGDVEVLGHSHRLPKEVHKYAQGILANISHRRPKPFEAAAHSGLVEYIDNLEYLDFTQGTWLILARSAYSLYEYAGFLRRMGMLFHFKDRGTDCLLACQGIQAYYRSKSNLRMEREHKSIIEKLSTNFDITKPWWETLDKISEEHRLWFQEMESKGEDLSNPRIQFSTLHGSKGTEAENVVICPDISYKAYREMQEHPDDESRVFYVGITRAKKNLYILTPQTRYYYDL